MTIDTEFETDIEGHRDAPTRVKVSEEYVVIVQNDRGGILPDVVQVDREKLEEALEEASVDAE